MKKKKVIDLGAKQVVHLRAYSEYSLLYSSARIEELAKAAVMDGMPALGVADRGGMYGAIAIYSALQKASVAPILGQTVRVVESRDIRPGMTKIVELALIATSVLGYRSLCELSSKAQLNSRADLICNTWDELRLHHEGLLCLTGGLDGPFGVALDGFASRSREEITAIIDRVWSFLSKIYGPKQVYVELLENGAAQPHEFNQVLYEAATNLHMPVVGTTEIRHMRQADLRLIDVLQGIKQSTSLSDAALQRVPGASFHFRTAQEMHALFKDFPGALEATLEIAQRARLSLSLHQLQMPGFELNQGVTEDAFLEQLATEKLPVRVKSPSLQYVQRLQYELSIIKKLGFSGYFLIVWDFIQYAHEHKISTGPGRGSAAGSLVAYVLSITDVDPIEYHLLFERFLNPERVSWPDIDIDFETERRYEVIHYVTQKYGADRVAQIGTLGTFAARAAIRDVGRVLQVLQHEIDQITRKIPGMPGVTLEHALAADESLRTMIERSPALSRTVELARRIEGLPRHPSIHAAGVVIAKTPLPSYVPLMPGAEGISVTQYSMQDIEALGLLKMDFLGLRTLTICDRTLRFIERTRGRSIAYDEVCMDEQTKQLLADGDTDGCFQLESNGVKHVLRELRPTDLEDLIAVISLYRPGPMEQIGAFIRARNGQEPIHYEVPELEPILAPTYGILVYQEQIMQIAASLAGFTLGEADMLRRAVSKKKHDDLVRARVDFVQGCLRKGFDEQVADRVYDLIVRFADYGFNRSHAAAYAVLALRTAYLKANYRAEFMSSLITDSVSRPDKVAQYALACRRAGIAVLQPDINESQPDSTPERQADGQVAVRLGLFCIKNVGTSAVQNICQERDSGGAFKSLHDLCERVDTKAATKRVLESLIQAGALDSVMTSRRQALIELERTFDQMVRLKPRRDDNQLSWPGFETIRSNELDTTPDLRTPERASPDIREEMDAWENELIGLVVSRDPFADVEKLRLHLATMTIQELSEAMQLRAATSNPMHFVAKIGSSRSVRTKKGEAMAFVTVEDSTASAELVLFPAVYRLLEMPPMPEQLVEVVARVDQNGSKSWIVVKFNMLDQETSLRESQEAEPALEQKHSVQDTRTVYIRIEKRFEEDRTTLFALRQILLRHQGSNRVVLIYESGKMRPLDALFVEINEVLLSEIKHLMGALSVRIDTAL